MTLDEAVKRLGKAVTETGLYSLGWYLGYNAGDGYAVLDGDFTADDLEAIAVYMRATQD